MSLYLDSSALVKRYVAEQGSVDLREAMAEDATWLVSQVAWIEAARAIGSRYGGESRQLARLAAEWPLMEVIALDQGLAEAAARLAIDHGPGSLDAIHLASALLVAHPTLRFATWDARLHAAAAASGLMVLPEQL